MTLLKTSGLNSIAVVIRLLTFLGINKVLSVYVGPVGYAFLGQYQNLITVITTLASGAINTGVTKYTAEYYDDLLKQRTLWQTATKMAFFGSLFMAIFMAVFSKPMAVFFLKNKDFSGVFLWFAGTLILFVMNALLLSILNGKKEIGFYVVANIAGSILALCVTTFLVVCFGLYGALVGLAIYQSCAFFITSFICYKLPWFKFNYLYGRLDPQIAKDLLKYALMAVVSAICIPGSQIVVRNYIGDQLNWAASGYIEAMWRLSAAYLMVVTATLTVYFLPKMAELKDPLMIKREVWTIYKVILPFTILSSLLIYLLRNILISMLFTQSFAEMEELFAWQMIGDTLKVSSWILMYLYLAKGYFRLYIFSEIFFSITFFLLVLLLESTFKLKSVAIAHAINYLFYFLFGFCSLRFNRIL
jgi:PST family polysaccharide transporter